MRSPYPQYTKHIEHRFLYFAERPDVGHIKIGFSSDVDARLATLSSQTKCKLVLRASCMAPFGAEKAVHLMFRQYRLYGEWFTPNPFLSEVINAVNDGNTAWIMLFRTRRHTSTGKFVQALLSRIGWTHYELSEWLSCSSGAVWSWIVGQSVPSSRFMHAMRKLLERLESGSDCSTPLAVPRRFWLPKNEQKRLNSWDKQIIFRNVVDMY